MTDRKLLELAAEAAGIQIGWYETEAFIVGDDGPDEWNPLTDDGDALRLAVRLRLQITTGRLGCIIQGLPLPDDISEDFAPGCDEMATVRRAIVRAAAEIGMTTRSKNK